VLFTFITSTPNLRPLLHFRNDPRGAISLVVDAYVKGSTFSIDSPPTGDSCATLMRETLAMSYSNSGTKHHLAGPTPAPQASQPFKAALHAVLQMQRDPTQCSVARHAAFETLQQCDNHLGAQLISIATRSCEYPDSLTELGSIALGATLASNLATRASIFALGSNSDPSLIKTRSELGMLCEEAYLKLSSDLENIGQLRLAVGALNLIFFSSPTSTHSHFQHICLPLLYGQRLSTSFEQP
jgi:hypothetical protein